MPDRHIEVVGPSGAKGEIDTARWPMDRPDATVRIEFDDGREVSVLHKDLRPLPDGRYELASLPGEEAPPARPPGTAAVIPVLEERLDVSTRPVDLGGVRIRKTVHQREQTVDLPLMHEEVLVERVAVQREVSGPLPVREEDGVIIVPLVEEVLVVRKAWVLREELRIAKRRFNIHRPTTVTLLAEQAEVQRLEPEPAAPAAGPAQGAPRPDSGPAPPGG